MITRDEYFEISRNLEKYHTLFCKCWELGKPMFTKTVKTAAVGFDDDGEYVVFYFNPDFWESLTTNQKTFVICHEILHIILNHGVRTSNSINRGVTDHALDIVVNHSLIETFNMDINEIDPEKQYCWIDTVFPEPSKIDSDRSFEYYFNEIIKMIPESSISDDEEGGGGGGGSSGDSGDSGSENSEGNLPGKLVDSHEKLSGEIPKEIIDDINESLTDEEKSSVKDFLDKNYENGSSGSGIGTGAGESPLGSDIEVESKKAKPKKKWETIIRKWTLKKIKDDEKTLEQWLRINKRYTNLIDDVILPTEMEISELTKKNDKTDVYFFLDASGSCLGFSNRFFKSSLTLPKKKFKAHFFSFDANVYEIKEKGKIHGGGGTKFGILERQIQEDLRIKKIKKYPNAVFVLTDGCCSDSIKPQYPKKWYWFLTDRGNKLHIPRDSSIFELKDFE